MINKLETLNLEKIWLWGIKIGIFLILLTPLIINEITTFPNIVPKTIYFRVLIEIVLLFYILLLLENRKYLPKISPLFISLFIFIEILAFSTWKSINPLRSFWGTIERMEGFILLLHLFVFFLVLVGVFQQKKDWLNLLRYTALVSIPVGIVGLLQKLEIFSFFSISSGLRISGTLGNPVFYGSYLVLIIFLALFLIFLEKNKKLRILFSGLAIYNFLLLIFTGTRGAWLGMALGIGFLLVIWFLFFGKKREEQRKFILFGIFILLFFFMLFLLFSKMGYLPETYFLDRYEALWNNLVEFKSGRLFVWQLGIEAWKNSPLFGYGLESFSYIYDKYYQANLLEKIPETMFFDRAHNKIVDTLVANGILGLLSYLAIFGTAILLVLKNNKENFNPLLPFILIALFIAYFVQNIFTFDTINSYLIFFLVLAFIDVNFRKTKEIQDIKEEEKNQPSKDYLGRNFKQINWLKIIIILLTFSLFAITIFKVNVHPVLSNIQLAKMHKLMAIGEPQKAFESLEGALNGPEFTKFETHYYTAETIFFAMPLPQYRSSQKEFSQQLQKIILPFESYLEEKPEILHMRSYLLLARIYRNLYLIEQDSKYLEDEERILGKAIKFNPQFPRVYRLAGEMRFLQQRKEEGMVFFAKAYELDKNWSNFYEKLGISLLEINEKEKGVEALRKSLKLGNFYTEGKFNLKTIWKLADIYEELGNYQEMADFYEEVILHYPIGKPHPQLYASLSVVYVKIGDRERVYQTTEKMLELYPELWAQAEEFLSTLEEE